MEAAHRLLGAELLRSLEGIAAAEKRRPYNSHFRTATRQTRYSTRRGNETAAAASGMSAAHPSNALDGSAERAESGYPALPTCPTEGIAGLEQLFRELFIAEPGQSIHLLVDATQSMGYASAPGHPTKFRYARRLAAAVGYAALARYGRFGISAFGHARGRRRPRLRDRAAASRLFSYLDGVAPGGSRDFSPALLDFAQRGADTEGVCVVVSDFLAPQWEKAIRALLARRFRVILVQLLDPEEVEPSFLEDLRLVDADSGSSREISVTPQVLARYRAALASFCGQLSDAAERHGMGYVRLTTEIPFEETLLRTLRGAGLLN